MLVLNPFFPKKGEKGCIGNEWVNLPYRDKILTVAVKNYAKANIKVL